MDLGVGLIVGGVLMALGQLGSALMTRRELKDMKAESLASRQATNVAITATNQTVTEQGKALARVDERTINMAEHIKAIDERINKRRTRPAPTEDRRPSMSAVPTIIPG